LIRLRLSGAKRSLVVLSLALAGCGTPLPASNPTPEAYTLRLITDNASAPLLYDLVSAYTSTRALIVWDIQVSDGAAVADWLQAGRAPYAFWGMLPDAVNNAPDYWLAPVGIGGVAFVVHPTNTVSDLSPDQVRNILSGRIVNWAELGGADRPIVVVARGESSTEGQLVQRIVLGDRRIRPDARLALTGKALIDLVAEEPGAAGFVSVGYLSSAVRPLALEGIPPTPQTLGEETYPLRSPIVIAGLEAPGDDAYRAFFAWVQSPAGQAVVQAQHGGIPAVERP